MNYWILKRFTREIDEKINPAGNKVYTFISAKRRYEAYTNRCMQARSTPAKEFENKLIVRTRKGILKSS